MPLMSRSRDEQAEAVPVAVELQVSKQTSEGLESEQSLAIGDAPLSHVHGGSWVLEASGLRDSIAEPETPDNLRLSRMSTDLRIATDEDVELELKEEAEKDTKAGVKRPDNYVKLGGKLPFRIARVAEDLTPMWLTTVLRFKKILPMEDKVIAVETKPIGEGGGVMGLIVLVKLTLSENAPDSVPRKMVAKFSPQGKLPLPRFMIRAVFLAESHFYNDFTIADGGMSRPQCYLALYDKPRRKPTFCMLLEDMMPAVSYTRVASCTEVEKLHAAMETLAKLHARWWNHPKAPPLDWLTHPTGDYHGLLLNGFVRVTKLGLASMAKVYKKEYEPVVAWSKTLRRRHKYILQELFRPPLTMIHGDAHIENVFYDQRFSGNCAFIDFGNMMFSQGVYDVSFFMAHSLDVETRRRHEKEVVKHYHEVLIANGVDLKSFPYERCWRDYKFNFWRTLIAVLAMGPSIEKDHKNRTGMFAEKPSKGDQQLREMYEKLNERIIAALLDHKWFDLAIETTEWCGLCTCIYGCY